MPTGKTLCCLRFKRKGRACRECPLLEVLPLSMQPGWLHRLNTRYLVKRCVGARIARYFARFKQRVMATMRR